MANPVLVAAPVSIVPAVAALWYLLKRYEDYFEDARVFLSLTFGFFAGLVAVLMESAAFPFADPRFVADLGPGTAFLFFVFGYALFETACKLVVLGSKRFRGRKDTPYYGAALGLGFGAMMALGFIALNLNASEFLNSQSGNATSAFDYGTTSFAAMAALPLGAIFVHGAVGVYVGRSTARGSLWKAWGIGSLLQAPVLVAMWFFWPSIGRGDVVVIAPALVTVVYGIALLHIARVKVLDVIVPQDIRDRVRRERRRQLRRAAAGRGEEE